VINNETVGNALISRGIYPERWPANEKTFKKIERELKSEVRKLQKSNQHLDADRKEDVQEFILHKINISKNLWKMSVAHHVHKRVCN